MWDLEFGDLLLGSIARGVRGCVANCPFRMRYMLVCFMRVVVESLDELIWVDLKIDSLISKIN